MDVALVSCAELPEFDIDAAPLQAGLSSAGLSSRVLAWDDPGVDWSLARMTVFRSSWNYPLHRDEFLAWAESTAQVTDLWNRVDVVRWNSHKSYLLTLEQKGIPVVPTVLLPRGSNTALAEIVAERGWRGVVIKPAVSAASLGTRRFDVTVHEEGEVYLRALVGQRDVLVQPHLPSVESYGERALVWIDGAITHAVRKSPRFEGQAESVSSTVVAISPAERALAQRAVAAVAGPLLYGRVDLAPGLDGQPVVMELELVEPSLFFAQRPQALERFVAAIRRHLSAPNR
ncbi:MAG: hypothetical protein MJE77_20745 [Proteobacteria bacterium]|nr:hypothetical protein [Pseudomonadota bacterium]